MEIFMRNIPADYDRYDVKSALSPYLHGPDFFNRIVNFDVYLHHPRSEDDDRTGALTVHDPDIGERFLNIYGNSWECILFEGNRIEFSPSRFEPRPHVLDTISRTPWVDPNKEREQERRETGVSNMFVALQSIQFGWMCRDDVFSIESEARQHAQLRFDFQRQELNVIVKEAYNDTSEYVIAARQSSILNISSHISPSDRQAIIFLQLEHPPSFFNRPPSVPGVKRTDSFQRLTTFPLVNNPLAIPYTSLAIRLVCLAPAGAISFATLADQANLRNLVKLYTVNVARRDLFSRNQLQAMDINIRSFDWCVAFQLEALVRNLCLDAKEVMELIPIVKDMVKSHGKVYVAGLLKRFAPRAKDFLNTNALPTISEFFNHFARDFAKEGDVTADMPTDVNFYFSLHVTVTPTTMFLGGPFLDKSNRVIRRYDRSNQENFLRVEFRDDNNLQYRFDRDVNGEEFIRERLGPIMHEGLVIAGRKFRFLAYSQSALKEHSVWFVKAFRDPKYSIVSAQKIIESLGSFSDLAYDTTLMYCPARYGARISQAFSATDVAVVDVDEILIRPDIKTENEEYTFTDGSGGMSEDLAREIWQLVCRNRDRSDFPRAYQIRFKGSKGMLSVDYTLKGSNTISLRESMIKFDAPDSREVEIARSFDQPTAYYLNRPLIMILEHLGVKYEVFRGFQEGAIRKTENATKSLSAAGHLLQNHGLGSSFKLPSTMISLAKLGLDPLAQDPHFSGLLRLAVYHVLRDLKHRARIPIPDAWTLVGVADTHRHLEEGEIFACIKHPEKGTFYLEGPVLISRSPTIYPGDVQLVRAIGGPTQGSCFARESLPNTVVFSVKGSRPLPTCLGGGDLDGDLYNIIPLKDHDEFKPRLIYAPASYLPAAKETTDYPATMKDVADFVMKYIVSDVVGMVANNWLIIADQQKSIIHSDCIRLAKLHSDAVDYQKTGRPVDIGKIPRPGPVRPDWSAPETLENIPSHKYYKSMSALGKLSRAIDLKAHEPSIPVQNLSRRGNRTSAGRVETITNDISSLDTQGTCHSAIFDAVDPLVARFFDPNKRFDAQISDQVFAVFGWFAEELRSVSSRFSLSHRYFKSLSEEELVVNTITQKTSQPALRKDKMAKLRESTDFAFRRVKDVLQGGDDRPPKEYLRYAWAAWIFSVIEVKRDAFGSKAFWWITLGLVFDALKVVEEAEVLESKYNQGQAVWPDESP